MSPFHRRSVEPRSRAHRLAGAPARTHPRIELTVLLQNPTLALAMALVRGGEIQSDGMGWNAAFGRPWRSLARAILVFVFVLSPPRSHSLTVPGPFLTPTVASIPSPSVAHRRPASAGSLLVVRLPLPLQHPYLIQLRVYVYPYLYSSSARRSSLHVDAALATRASSGQRCAARVFV